MDSQEYATLRNIEHNSGKIKDELAAIKALLVEIRDNTKPPDVLHITTFGTAAPLYSTPDGPRPTCICLDYRPGELSGGWTCPVHGQQF